MEKNKGVECEYITRRDETQRKLDEGKIKKKCLKGERVRNKKCTFLLFYLGLQHLRSQLYRTLPLGSAKPPETQSFTNVNI